MLRQIVPALGAIALSCGVLAGAQKAPSQTALGITVLSREPARDVPRFGRFELTFTLANTVATDQYWPYDAAPPRGIPAGTGVSVDAVFLDPRGREYRQPGFVYQPFEEQIRNGRDWHYPTGDVQWKVRFAPGEPGTWKYRIVARDRSGTGETEWQSFSVAPSQGRGFVRVSKADSRYFEFEDGTLFTGLGVQLPEFLEDPVTKGYPEYQQLEAYGINFARVWVSSLYGSAWTRYVGGRNRYAGYLPVAGVMPVQSGSRSDPTFSMRIDYEPAGDVGWFDACRFQFWNDPEAVKPRTRYRVAATFRGFNIAGPRHPRQQEYGFVVKLGGRFPNCYEPGTSRLIAGHGRSNSTWGDVEGIWNSGERFFLPKIHLALENVLSGQAYVRSLSVREYRADGTLGPEILTRASLEYDRYVPQEKAFALDKIVSAAERHGVFLKLVVLEKGDEIYQKLADTGDYVTSSDNRDGVYGTGRTVNRTRWLQQAWWRYLQARWGYSTSIHSWELLNEGDPASVRHYELADEFGKFMHYGVFGASPSRTYDHPNDHLVTTSFWHSFPVAEFWGNPKYPFVDYADLHAYVSTTFAPAGAKQEMTRDAAYYHIWHSQAAAEARLTKPVVRGEAGLDLPGRQDERALGLQRDRAGVWLHTLLWSSLHSGALYEVYWWRSHIWNERQDLRSVYRPFSAFLSDLELNRGGYRDWGGRVSSPALRVVGQKNLDEGRMHLWIQNTAFTWKNAVDGVPIPPVSGAIEVPGFTPGGAYRLEWWDTRASDRAITAESIITADGTGILRIGVEHLKSDAALKLRRAAERPRAAAGEGAGVGRVP